MLKYPPKVLIVDDSPIIVERLKELIKEEGITHEIMYANNYRSALFQLELFQPDLIFFDITLPDGNGIDLLRRAKAKYSDARAIMITNHADDYYKNLCLTLGAEAFLDKSLDFEKITHYIGQLSSVTLS